MDADMLRRRRRELSLSQLQLGRLLDVPQQTVARWETGVHRIEHGMMLELALEAIQVRAAVRGVAPRALLEDMHDPG